jgi:ABC-type antimicrobial peptide transport system permease subunit
VVRAILPAAGFQPASLVGSAHDAASVAEKRFQLTPVLVFAAITLVLACLGIFGVVSYTVAQRRVEMGIRRALGATAGDLRTMVVRQGLAPVMAFLLTGVAAAACYIPAMIFSRADPLSALRYEWEVICRGGAGGSACHFNKIRLCETSSPRSSSRRGPGS